ncbi:MAG: ERF family protein, partial [Erysipelothrix sp.]
MKIYIYDFEVFKKDWIVVFKSIDGKESEVFHNDNTGVKKFVKNKCLCGFNSKWYDDWILLSIINGASNEVVKKHNDHIISGQSGWTFGFINYKKKSFDSMDLRDDLPQDLSLKEIEGNMCLPIVESSVPFDIDRELNQAELEEVIEYCIHDVEATRQLFIKRKDYINSKKIVAEIKGMSIVEALKLTNAKLSARYLEATKTERNDVRTYRIPSNIKLERIPQELIVYFAQLNNASIPLDKFYESNLTIKIAGCKCVYGFGGVHGANGKTDINNDNQMILNYDVASLYPNCMINYDYVSRNVHSKKLYADVVEKRLDAKHSGDKKTADALKLIINTTYGSMLQKFNDLYDELMGRSVCITNQLAMTDLAVGLSEVCPSMKMHNFNTDGIMFTIQKNEYDTAQKIIKEWEERTKFKLEEDNIKRYCGKDVNNYFVEFIDGTFKAKGGWIGRFDGGDIIKNSMIIVQKAIVNNLKDNIPVEVTINECQNIFDFQIITKTGRSYKTCFHEVNGELIEVQRVNRVYATSIQKYGKIFKHKLTTKKGVEGLTDRYDTIADTPNHCIIDNDNQLTINDIDKQFYIDLANKRLSNFINMKESNKMPKTKIEVPNEINKPESLPTTTRALLMIARLKFLNSDINKSGKNSQLTYKYYELNDIVPIALPIFQELGLFYQVSFTNADLYEMNGSQGSNPIAEMKICKVDDPKDAVYIVIPYTRPQAIVGNASGKAVVNDVQLVGMSVTYYRRYLWMLALDIVESDGIDGDKPPVENEQVKKSKKPASPEERKGMAKDMTS